jgi:hypothetical protein
MEIWYRRTTRLSPSKVFISVTMTSYIRACGTPVGVQRKKRGPSIGEAHTSAPVPLCWPLQLPQGGTTHGPAGSNCRTLRRVSSAGPI